MTHPLPAVSPWAGDFPALQRTVHGRRLAFLDSGASAQKPQVVLDTLTEVLGGAYANIHRGLYFNSAETTSRFEAARERIARFLNADPAGLVLTRGSTESINLVAQSWGRDFLQAGDVVLVSALEHHANIVPWQLLREELGIDLRVVPMAPDGAVTVEAFRDALSQLGDRVKLVALTQMSNVLGVRLPLAEIIPLAHAAGALVLVDGSQGMVHAPQDLAALGADFYAATGHKLYGPTGVGVLWARPEILADMPPWQGGGDMIESVAWDRTTYASGVARFEAGTPPIAEVIGLAAAMDYVDGIGWAAIAAHEHAVAAYLEERLAGVERLQRYGMAGAGNGIASFNLAGCHPHDVATLLDQQGVAVRSGHHCAMPLHADLGVPGTVRASIGLYTGAKDIDQLVAGLAKARAMLA